MLQSQGCYTVLRGNLRNTPEKTAGQGKKRVILKHVQNHPKSIMRKQKSEVLLNLRFSIRADCLCGLEEEFKHSRQDEDDIANNRCYERNRREDKANENKCNGQDGIDNHHENAHDRGQYSAYKRINCPCGG